MLLAASLVVEAREEDEEMCEGQVVALDAFPEAEGEGEVHDKHLRLEVRVACLLQKLVAQVVEYLEDACLVEEVAQDELLVEVGVSKLGEEAQDEGSLTERSPKSLAQAYVEVYRLHRSFYPFAPSAWPSAQFLQRLMDARFPLQNAKLLHLHLEF